MYKVLVACLDGWNTLVEVPRMLKKGGCQVNVLCKADAWLKANSYYDTWIPSVADPSDFRHQLIELVKSGDYNWVILGDDPLIKLLNEYIEDEELFKKILPINKISNRNILSSKSGLSEICEKYSIPTPGHLTFKENKPAITEVTGKLTFPMIIKKDFGWGGSNIFICNNETELETQLNKITAGEKTIIQEYITGPEVPVEALYVNGELVKYNVSKILEYDKDQFSYSTRRIYYLNTDIKKYLVKLGKDVGINGFVNMAYMHDIKKDIYYLIEVDIRPNSWMACGKFIGNDFVDGIKYIVSLTENPGNPYVLSETNSTKPTEIALFHKDIRRALYKKDIKGLVKWVYNYRYWKYLPLNDFNLTRRISKELWKEFVVSKSKKIFKT